MGNVNGSTKAALQCDDICDALSLTNADIEKMKNRIKKSSRSSKRSHNDRRSRHPSSWNGRQEKELIDEVYDFIKQVKKSSKHGDVLLQQFVELQTTGAILTSSQATIIKDQDKPPVLQIFILRDPTEKRPQRLAAAMSA